MPNLRLVDLRVSHAAFIAQPTQRPRLARVSPRTGLPPNAILSHTKEAEEVTFVNLSSGYAWGRTGYRKIIFYGEQVDRDKLQYFWVDSCCIDKRNNIELTKAINSTFSYYHNALKCYVYPFNVSCSARNVN